MPSLGLFRKPKKEEPVVEKPVIETPPETNETQVKTYLKAMPLRELADLETVKTRSQEREHHNSTNNSTRQQKHRRRETSGEPALRVCRIHQRRHRALRRRKSSHLPRQNKNLARKNTRPKRADTYSSLKVSKTAGTTALIPALLSMKLARFIIFDFSP